MKLYMISVGSIIVDWAGTQIDAKDKAKGHSGEWEEHEVPTDKPSLLAWLREYAVGKPKALATSKLPAPTPSKKK